MARQKMLTFTLKGSVGRWVEYRLSDPERFEGDQLEEMFEAHSFDLEVEIAQGKIRLFLEKNKEHAPDPSEPAQYTPLVKEQKKYEFTLLQHVWAKKFHPAQPAQRKMVLGPPTRARKARVEESILV